MNVQYMNCAYHQSLSSTGCDAAHRLGESHAGDGSVEHTHPDHMQRVEAHRVPHTHVRSQQLDTGEQSVNIYTNIWEDIAISLLLVHKKLTKLKKTRTQLQIQNCKL